LLGQIGLFISDEKEKYNETYPSKNSHMDHSVNNWCSRDHRISRWVFW